jgi:hypothetical protein
MKTIFDNDFKLVDKDYTFKYQVGLTEKLDSNIDNFDQNNLNEIVLWKVNRYANFPESIIKRLNKIKNTDTIIDEKLTREILSSLLVLKGVALAMASTILRFKNKNIYQIIDQRVYRIIYGSELKTTKPKKKEEIENQINLYLKYLKDLKKSSIKLKIDYSKADRILYMADKRLNKEHKIKT